MKGDPKVIERLNQALFLELGAVNQYWVHYRLLEDWGYQKLANLCECTMGSRLGLVQTLALGGANQRAGRCRR